MRDVLVRGLPGPIHDRIQKMARSENLSINQALIRLIQIALKDLESKTEEERRRAVIFERTERLRQALRRKYGNFDDSTKLIREDRNRR